MKNKIILSKEIVLNIDDSFEVKYGFVNKKNPIVAYVSFKTWIAPKNVETVERDINCLINVFKKDLRRKIFESDKLEKRYIIDEYVNYNTMKPNKKNYFLIEVFLKKREINTLEEFGEYIENEFKDILNKFSFNLKNEMLSLNKNKK